MIVGFDAKRSRRRDGCYDVTVSARGYRQGQTICRGIAGMLACVADVAEDMRDHYDRAGEKVLFMARSGNAQWNERIENAFYEASNRAKQ